VSNSTCSSSVSTLFCSAIDINNLGEGSSDEIVYYIIRKVYGLNRLKNNETVCLLAC
jgi:hypothetical protein